MLARTDLQHIAGTRCPLDFVEVPSNFLEQFAKSPMVLSTFARHYQSGAPLDPSLLTHHQQSSQMLSSLETQNQLQMALLDQLYHSELGVSTKEGNKENFDSTRTLEVLQSKVNVIPFVPETAWQVQFSHLFSYGASYYSYFWARKWGVRVYRRLFKETIEDESHPPMPWRVAGEMVRRELLGIGGGRDPWVGLEKIGVVREADKGSKVVGEIDDLGFDAQYLKNYVNNKSS
jgi:mitochondrial intermediate peptidase